MTNRVRVSRSCIVISVIVLLVVACIFTQRHLFVIYHVSGTLSNWIHEQRYDDLATKGRLSDKFAVKAFAASCGVQTIPTLLATKDPDDLLHFAFPESQGFALKSSSGSGKRFSHVSSPGQEINPVLLHARGRAFMAEPTLGNHKLAVMTGITHEPQYALNDRVLMVEPFMRGPDEYKIYIVKGRVAFVQIDTGEPIEHRSIVDADFSLFDWDMSHPRHPEVLVRPPEFDLMISQSLNLVREARVAFARVDMTIFDGRVILTEMTFTPAVCRFVFSDPRVDAQMFDEFCV